MNLSTTSKIDKSGSSKKLYLVAAVAALALILGGAFVYKQLGTKGGAAVSGLAGSPLANLAGGSSYWAVFLTNGQTYFGRLDPDDLNGNYVKLSEVYYLEKTAAPATTTGKAVESATPGYNLIHLGNELHGPKDEMVINRQSVLFIEQLKTDSKVVTTIQSAKR